MFSALEDIEFETFIEPLRKALETFRKVTKEKKSSKVIDSKTENDVNEMGAVDEEMDVDVNESTMQEPTDGTQIEE